jgi:hypothetical protein
MPNKLFVHVEPENHFVGPTDFVKLCSLHLEGGHSYLVQAKGLLGPEAGVFMDMRLDVHGPSGTVVTSTESSYININQQFVLTAAAKLPAGGGGAGRAAATLLVKTVWINHQPGHSASITDIVLTALQMDQIVTG